MEESGLFNYIYDIKCNYKCQIYYKSILFYSICNNVYIIVHSLVINVYEDNYSYIPALCDIYDIKSENLFQIYIIITSYYTL